MLSQIRFFASPRSAGTKPEFGGESIVAEDASAADYAGLGIVFFSAG
ncbi:MAG: hypothetical protein WEA77_14355 [Hyphomonas sp.]